MNTETMRELIVFSRHLNFSRAAAQLNMAQPTLSTHIAAAERELGFKLVDRRQPIALTPGGKQFCMDLQRILHDFDASVKACSELMGSTGGGTITFELPLRLGDLDQSLNLAIVMLKKKRPDIEVVQRPNSDRGLRDLMRSGLVDSGVIANAELLKYHLEYSQYEETLPIPQPRPLKYYAWLHESHPLAARTSIAVKELDGSTLLIPANVRYGMVADCMRIVQEHYDAQVNVKYWPGLIDDCVLNVAEDQFIIACETDVNQPAYLYSTQRVFVEIEDMGDVIKPCLVVLKNNQSPAVNALRNVLNSGNNN